MMLRKRFILLSSCCLLSSFTFAANHEVVSTTCLANKMTSPHQTLAKNSKFSLIRVSDEGIDELITLKMRFKNCGGFVDVSHLWQKSHSHQANQFLAHYNQDKTSDRAAYTINYQKQVTQLLNQMNPQNMWTNLTSLTNYPDRYANSKNGVAAADWIKKTVLDYAKAANREDIEAFTVATGHYKQPSVVVKFGNGDADGVVVGGHMDTLSSTFSKKPGADDDGTGSVTVLEVARTLISSGLHFKHPIYFIWYAAEEEGLVGSGHVVDHFKKNQIPVKAVIQFDMTGYAYQNDPTIWLINDYVNSDLTKYLETIVNTYVKQPVKYTTCGYACSDHASWHQAGFSSSMPFESSFGKDNPDIHSSRDTMDHLNLDHMADYAKIGLAFATELAEPTA